MTRPHSAPPLKVQLRLEEAWLTICDFSALTPGRGVAALLPDGRQAAVFRDRAGRTYAIDNRDPFSGAAVLSRGLTGSHQGRPFVASPLLKQRFDLGSGRCLDDETVTVTTYEVRTYEAGTTSAQLAHPLT
ncbi:nitrite reductase small subunit NirD [Streptomyces sp. RPA4-2]|uniref:nitrite reductase small subunit NirD n=1 Tax=Streptomyces sp. RPA4-2 TaxID=2721244 RepID=UPI00143E1F25|nr:nitrite reductase small subunit NirD [Streptomyces sp. RPA4-2]QIY62532.1 nitrite reductase small subunit NirD [Streptomyces sp. RPA4-2]